MLSGGLTRVAFSGCTKRSTKRDLLDLPRALWHRLPNFRALLCLFAIIFGLSSITLVVGVANLAWMRASASTPWGVVTAIFVHAGVDHYADNMEGLLLLFPLFAVLNVFPDDAEQRRRACLFVWTVVVAAVTANVAWVWYFPTASPADGALGASGVLYAAIGMVLMAGLANAFDYIVSWSRDHTSLKDLRRKDVIVFLANLLISLGLVLLVVLSRGGFIGVGEPVNFLSHGVALMAALPVFIGYWVWRMAKESRKLAFPPKG